ncbi:hypothetical protein Brsp06_04845 [Brucella sp. NBRC 13694]|jgi:hypothetical protein
MVQSHTSTIIAEHTLDNSWVLDTAAPYQGERIGRYSPFGLFVLGKEKQVPPTSGKQSVATLYRFQNWNSVQYSKLPGLLWLIHRGSKGGVAASVMAREIKNTYPRYFISATQSRALARLKAAS